MKSIARAFLLVAAAAAALAGVAAEEQLPSMPLYSSLPSNCGLLAQVTPKLDTCAKIADASDVDETMIDHLNPYMMCSKPLQIGSSICIGNSAAFCNHVVMATSKDTCASIAAAAGGVVVNVAGTNSTECDTLEAGVPVCVSTAVQTAARTLGSSPLTPKFQKMLESLPDFSAIIAEGIATVESATVEGKDALVITITTVSPAVKAVLAHPGHPYLSLFAQGKANGSAKDIIITLVADWFSGLTPGMISTVITPSTEVMGRKMLGGHYIRRYPGGTTIGRCCQQSY